MQQQGRAPLDGPDGPLTIKTAAKVGTRLPAVGASPSEIVKTDRFRAGQRHPITTASPTETINAAPFLTEMLA